MANTSSAPTEDQSLANLTLTSVTGQSIVPFNPVTVDKARAFIQAGLSGAANSQRGYRADIKQYLAWCEEHGLALSPLPVRALILYVTDLSAGKKFATLQRHVASISRLHRLAEHESPTTSSQFAVFMKGIRLSMKNNKKLRQKQAPVFTLDAMRQAVDLLPDTPTGRRDKAILLLGFLGAFRREELVRLDVDQVKIDEQGLLVTLGHSKTNQYGEIEEKAVTRSDNSYCAVAALEALILDLPSVDEGTPAPLFRRIRKGQAVTGERLSNAWVNRVVQQRLGDQYTAHSLRASFVTIAKGKGVDNRTIMNQTKHVTTVMLDRYDHRRNVRDDNATQKIGL